MEIDEKALDIAHARFIEAVNEPELDEEGRIAAPGDEKRALAAAILAYESSRSQSSDARDEASLKALDELVSLVEDDTGAHKHCADDADEESVGWHGAKPLPMTFGHVRRARKALDALKRADREGD